MVFFSTCDSVDFHALLFRETQWPEDLDAAIEGQPGEREREREKVIVCVGERMDVMEIAKERYW